MYLDLPRFLDVEQSETSEQTNDGHSRLILGNNGVRRERDSRFFFISNKKCPVVFLNQEVSYSDTYLLLFNSDLYPSPCFYYENSTETLYATVRLLDTLLVSVFL